jgi:hypothetical protein
MPHADIQPAGPYPSVSFNDGMSHESDLGARMAYMPLWRLHAKYKLIAGIVAQCREHFLNEKISFPVGPKEVLARARHRYAGGAPERAHAVIASFRYADNYCQDISFASFNTKFPKGSQEPRVIAESS